MADMTAMTESEDRSAIRLLLRVSRAGSRTGWTPELEYVWDQAAVMALRAGVAEGTIGELKGASVLATEMWG